MSAVSTQLETSQDRRRLKISKLNRWSFCSFVLSRNYGTRQNCSVSDILRSTKTCLDLSPVQFTPLTRTRQDSAVLSTVECLRLNSILEVRSTTSVSQMWLSHWPHNTSSLHRFSCWSGQHLMDTYLLLTYLFKIVWIIIIHTIFNTSMPVIPIGV